MPLQKSSLSNSSPAIRTRTSLHELVHAARAGDERAWAMLVRRLEPTMRRIVRRYRLSAAQTDDVIQTAWLRLFTQIGSIRAPEMVGAWLGVTVRREAFRVLQGRVREYVTDIPPVDEIADADGPETALLRAARRDVLARAIATLPARHRLLMDVMLSEPGLDYREVSARTGIPKGSIGPIRGRCLARLADHPEVQALRD
jgi:RNA polymerase sigma factor (sigma-70 family)